MLALEALACSSHTPSARLSSIRDPPQNSQGPIFSSRCLRPTQEYTSWLARVWRGRAPSAPKIGHSKRAAGAKDSSGANQRFTRQHALSRWTGPSLCSEARFRGLSIGCVNYVHEQNRSCGTCFTMSYQVSSYRIIPYHIMSYNAIPHHITSYQTISYRITSHHIISHHIAPYHIISYHIISYHILSCHITSYHTRPSHTISYHITSYRTILSYHIMLYQIISYVYTSICT